MTGYVDRREDVTSDLVACKKVFDVVGVHWVIMGGIVLGYARYNDIMPWDTDVDIGIFGEVSDGEWQIIVQNLRFQGFRQVIVQKADFTYCFRKTNLDLWLYHKTGDYYEAFPPTTPGLKFIEKAMWYDEPQMVQFVGDEYPMPNYINDYLDCRYGRGWETHIMGNHDDFFTYKRGHRSDQAIWPVGRCGKHGPLWPKILKIEESIL